MDVQPVGLALLTNIWILKKPKKVREVQRAMIALLLACLFISFYVFLL